MPKSSECNERSWEWWLKEFIFLRYKHRVAWQMHTRVHMKVVKLGKFLFFWLPSEKGSGGAHQSEGSLLLVAMHASSKLQRWVHGGSLLQGHCAMPLLHQLVECWLGLWAQRRGARASCCPIQLDQPQKVIGEGSSAAPGTKGGLGWKAL